MGVDADEDCVVAGLVLFHLRLVTAVLAKRAVERETVQAMGGWYVSP